MTTANGWESVNVRIRKTVDDYLKQCAERSGLSRTVCAAMLLETAMREGWVINPPVPARKAEVIT